MKVYPVPGRLVRDPRTRVPVPAEGRDVPETSFWHRLVNDGDVSLIPVAAEPAAHEAEPGPPAGEHS